jgi:hypothetical protein
MSNHPIIQKTINLFLFLNDNLFLFFHLMLPTTGEDKRISALEKLVAMIAKKKEN